MSIESVSVREAVLGVLGAIGGAFTIWRMGSKTKREVAEDQLGVKESKSKGDWLHDQEQRLEASMEREVHLSEALRVAHRTIAATEARIVLLQEGSERKDRRIARLQRALLKERPDYADALDSLPGGLEPIPLNYPKEDTKP